MSRPGGAAIAGPVEVGAPAGTTSRSTTYTQILRSTAVIGGSSIVNIGFAIIRNKAMAVLLGPQGVGLMGLYGSIAELAQTLAGMGVQASGVRQIAEASGDGEDLRVARTATVLRRISVLLGTIGAVLLALFSIPIAQFTFADHGHAFSIALLSVAVFFRLVSAGQMALVQGLRRVGDIARINMLAAFFSTLISIPLVVLFAERGIVPALVAMAVASVATSWWFARKVRLPTPRLSWPQMSVEAKALLRLGLVFMASGLLTVGAAYAVRIIVLRHDGVEAAGLYQAAWALGGLYAGFILQAMGTDFYPRLTAVARDDDACNRLVNEQAQISILLAGPGLLATLTVAPLVISLFYSPEFRPAVDVLRWICLGMMLRIVAWPMGFIVLAKGAQRMFFWTETAATCVHVGLAWLLVGWLGLVGSGAAFFGLYVWHACIVYVLVRRLSGFRWSPANIRLGLIFLPASAAVFVACRLLPPWQAMAFGTLVTGLSGVYALNILVQLLPADAIPVRLQKWMPRMRGANGAEAG